MDNNDLDDGDKYVQNNNIRELRDAHTFKSGAVYSGEWMGNNRDG